MVTIYVKLKLNKGFIWKIHRCPNNSLIKRTHIRIPSPQDKGHTPDALSLLSLSLSSLCGPFRDWIKELAAARTLDMWVTLQSEPVVEHCSHSAETDTGLLIPNLHSERLSDTIRRNQHVHCDVIQHTYRVPLLTELKNCSLVRFMYLLYVCLTTG